MISTIKCLYFLINQSLEARAEELKKISLFFW